MRRGKPTSDQKATSPRADLWFAQYTSFSTVTWLGRSTPGMSEMRLY
jgi:hypothetical protein